MCKFVILLAALVACNSLVNGMNKNQCMRPWGRMNFDQDKFGGEWYVVAKVMSAALPKMASTCNKANMAVTHDGNVTHVTCTMSVKVEGQEVKFLSKSQPVSPHFSSITQATWKKEGDEHWMGLFSQSVLATDYEDFAIIYACQPVYVDATDMFDKKEIIQIMSRKPEMESTLMNVLKNVLSGFDFDVSEMMMIDNANC